MGIFSYVDYRTYVADEVRIRREKNKGVSLRLLAKKAGFGSPGYVQQIIVGKKNLRPKSATNLALALKLADHEVQYFCQMVEFNQAKKIEDKARYLLGMQVLVRKSRRHAGLRIFSVHQSWYNLAILELAHCPGFDLNLVNLKQTFGDRVSSKELQTALTFLEETGYLKRQGRALSPFNKDELQTPDEVSLTYIQAIHRKSAELAGQALNLPLEIREFQNITIALSISKVRWLKLRLKQLREDLMQELANDPQANCVYHVNLQAFPITEVIK